MPADVAREETWEELVNSVMEATRRPISDPELWKAVLDNTRNPDYQSRARNHIIKTNAARQPVGAF